MTDRVETILGWLTVIAVTGVIVALIGQTVYKAGYRNGQIDALEGTVWYASVEAPFGEIFWYRKYMPEKLYPSRKKSDD